MLEILALGFNQVMFAFTVLLFISYSINLLHQISNKNNENIYMKQSFGHAIHFWTYIFIGPFLLSIAYSVNAMTLQFMHVWELERNGIDNIKFLVFYIPVALGIYVFVWAFFRSLYTISLLDMGIWARSGVFKDVVGIKTKYRNWEIVLRSLIIIAFIEHHIIVAEMVAAPIKGFYGMNAECSSYFGGIIPHPLEEMPLICGPVNTLVFSFKGIFLGNFSDAFGNEQVRINGNFVKNSVKLLVGSAILVSLAILAWSIATEKMYKSYFNNINHIDFIKNQSESERALKKLKTQRKCVISTLICAFYMGLISNSSEMSITTIVVFSTFCFFVIMCAGYVLLVVAEQSGMIISIKRFSEKLILRYKF